MTRSCRIDDIKAETLELMKGPYLQREQPPVCLHALGQPLVEAIWHEGVSIKHAADKLLSVITVGDLVANRLTPEAQAALIELKDAVNKAT